MHPIILASQSPRRKQLLEWAEVPFEVIVKHADENYPPELPIAEVPEYIAYQKALAVKQSLQKFDESRMAYTKSLPIVAADTVVVLHGQILGKPESREQAIAYLTALSGQAHKVLTGVVVMHGEVVIRFTDTTTVHFHDINAEEIAWYVDKYQPYDKAGAYAIQEWIGVVGISRVDGDFYNVMGLPVSRVVQALRSLHHG